MSTRYIILGIILVLLVLFSAFFSSAETGMMSLNRYRLRHAVRKGDPRAKRVMDLLARPDRLLGLILIGNTIANIFASAIATILAGYFFGEFGIIMITICLTMIILIFGESAPKTLAAVYPEKVALPTSAILKVLLQIFYPFVWFINLLGNGLLRLFGVKLDVSRVESLSIDELKTLLDETKGKLTPNYKKMLLRILDLELVSIEEIMVPRNEIFGIDLNEPWEKILELLYECSFTYAPLYRDDINHAQGMLNLRQVLILLQQKKLNQKDLIDLAQEIYFIPKEASANQQLLNFRDQKKTIGLVVDEYGDIQGLVTLQNILEEIVGEFTQDIQTAHIVIPQKDGSFLIDAGIDIRDLNEQEGWQLPTDGPRTLSGLIIEYLEMIPTPGVCTRLAGYPLEILKVGHNTIKLIKLWPQLYQSQVKE